MADDGAKGTEQNRKVPFRFHFSPFTFNFSPFTFHKQI